MVAATVALATLLLKDGLVPSKSNDQNYIGSGSSISGPADIRK